MSVDQQWHLRNGDHLTIYDEGVSGEIDTIFEDENGEQVAIILLDDLTKKWVTVDLRGLTPVSESEARDLKH